MDNHHILLLADIPQGLHPLLGRLLPVTASAYHPFQFCDLILPRISPQNLMPSLQAHYQNPVNIRMLLKILQGVNDQRLFIHVHKLFRHILLRPASTAPCQNQGYIHLCHFLRFLSVLLSRFLFILSAACCLCLFLS